MDKKTLGLLLVLGLAVAFLFFFSRNSKLTINDFIKFGDYRTNDSTASGRSTFSDLMKTPTPSPTLPPSPTLSPTP